MENSRLFNKGYVLFVILQTVNFILFYMSYPIIPQYAENNGIELSLIGIIAGAGTFGALFARPFAGFCMDHINKKRCMIVSMLLCGITTIALPYNTSVVYLSVVRIIYGASFAFSSIAMTSCATDFVPKNRTGEGIGYIGLGIAVAAAIGPGIGLGISDKSGFAFLFIVIGLVCILCSIIILFLKMNNESKKDVHGKISINSFISFKALTLAVFVIPFSFAAGFVSSFIAIVAKNRGISNITIFFTVYAVAMIVLKPLSGRIMDRKGIVAIMVPSFICAALGTVLIAHGHTLIIMIMAAVFLAFGQGAGQPSLQAQCINIVDSSRRGVAISTYYLGLDFGNMLGNVCGSGIAAKVGYEGAFLFCTVFLIISLLFFLIVQKKNTTEIPPKV